MGPKPRTYYQVFEIDMSVDKPSYPINERITWGYNLLKSITIYTANSEHDNVDVITHNDFVVGQVVAFPRNYNCGMLFPKAGHDNSVRQVNIPIGNSTPISAVFLNPNMASKAKIVLELVRL